MTKNLIHTENVLARLQAEMSAEMQRAAEPIIQAAVAEAEKKIRERVAAMCISLIQRDFSVTRMGDLLQITVRGFDGKKS